MTSEPLRNGTGMAPTTVVELEWDFRKKGSLLERFMLLSIEAIGDETW